MTRIAPYAMLLAAGCSDGVPAPADQTVANAVANDPAADSVFETPAPDNEARPAAPEPASIPAKFRGAWADDMAACTDPGHHSRLTVSERALRFPTFAMVADSIATPAADQFALKGHVEGTDRPIEAHYFLGGAGNVLTDGGGGGAVRVKCG